jgi:hypothetical protein
VLDDLAAIAIDDAEQLAAERGHALLGGLLGIRDAAAADRVDL